MLEQEIASIIKYTLNNAGNPSPYYNEVPESFLVPAAYFPPPEIDSRGDTLTTYALSYTWFIKFFHRDTPLAYDIGRTVLAALQGGRNFVPLIDETGIATGQVFQLKHPSLKKVEGASGVVQLELSWDSPRPYNTTEHEKIEVVTLDMHTKDAYDAAIEQAQGGQEESQKKEETL